jgi:hypothetical protein
MGRIIPLALFLFFVLIGRAGAQVSCQEILWPLITVSQAM